MPDPDLEIRGGGGGVIQTLRQGGPFPPPNFLVLRAPFWSKNRGGASPPGPSHGSDTIS